jgi:hypothetical protein
VRMREAHPGRPTRELHRELTMRLSSVIRLASFALFTLGLSCASDPTSIRETGSVQFSIAAGDNQIGQAGQELPFPISVVATDQNNNPVAGQVVNFVVTSGGGSVYALASQTNQNGVAADIWTVGTVSGVTQTLEVRAVDATGTKHVYGVFTASVIGGTPASIMAAAGDGQSASAGSPVPIRPAVRVLDQYGNPSPGQSVVFSIASGGGNLTGANALSDAQGVATVGNWTLGASPGANTLTATQSDPGTRHRSVEFRPERTTPRHTARHSGGDVDRRAAAAGWGGRDGHRDGRWRRPAGHPYGHQRCQRPSQLHRPQDRRPSG